jgi:hypothetical protein
MWSSKNLTAFRSGLSVSFPTVSVSPAFFVDGFSVTPEFDSISATVGAVWLQGSHDNITWIPVASSSARFVVEGVRFLETFSTWSWRAGNELSFENRMTWPLALKSVVGCVLVALGCFGVGISGVRNRPIAAKRCFVWCAISMAASNFLSMVGYLSYDNLNAKEAFFTAVQFIVFNLMALILHYAELWFAELLSIVAVVTLAGRAVEDIALFRDPQYLLASAPISSFVVAFAGFGFIASRSRYLTEVLRKADATRALHDAEWQRILVQPEALARLRRAATRAATRVAARSCAERQPRHYNRLMSTQCLTPPASSGSRRSSEDLGNLAVSVSLVSTDVRRSEPGTRDVRQPVVSLDQLYTQAMGLASGFFGRCKEWAAATGGALDEGLDGEQWDTLPGWMNRRIIKRPERAIEKVAVCYGGDVSRLIDLCRARMVFEDTVALCACLELIESRDGQPAEVVRIKNSMHEQHNSRRTAGFRVSAGDGCLLCTILQHCLRRV